MVLVETIVEQFAYESVLFPCPIWPFLIALPGIGINCDVNGV